MLSFTHPKDSKRPGRSSESVAGSAAHAFDGKPGKRPRTRAKNRGTNRRGITKDPELQEKVVIATFLHNGQPSFRSAAKVAKELGLSTQAVVSLVRRAFKEEIVSALVALPVETVEIHGLERALKERYRLKDVLLVPGLPQILNPRDKSQREALHIQIVRAMAQRAVKYLDSIIAEAVVRQKETHGDKPDPFRLGVAWGRTMHLIAECLGQTVREARCEDLHVLPIIGITSTLNTLPVEANVVAMEIARAYGGVSAQLPMPAFTEESLSIFLQHHQVRDMVTEIGNCDAVITGMGPILDDVRDMTVSNDKDLNKKMVESAHRSGAIGEICYWLFDRNGQKVSTTFEAIGLGLDGLRRIAQDPNRRVILVCGGDRHRFQPLKVALRAGFASVLVSDTVTARYLAEK